MKWTEFDKPTGRIQQFVQGSNVVPPDETDSLGRLDDEGPFNSLTHYVDASRTVQPRPVSSVTANLAGNILTLGGVALGALVQLAGDADLTVTQDASDGGLQLTFPTPGTYSLGIEQFPDLPFSAIYTI